MVCHLYSQSRAYLVSDYALSFCTNTMLTSTCNQRSLFWEDQAKKVMISSVGSTFLVPSYCTRPQRLANMQMLIDKRSLMKRARHFLYSTTHFT